MHIEKWGVVIAAGLLGWALCAAAMGIASAATPQAEALVIHALVAPILFVFVSRLYFQKYAYTTPLQTACIFVSIAILMDFLVVGLLLNHGLGLFASPLGTWVPLLLIFSATHITGLLVVSTPHYRVPVR